MDKRQLIKNFWISLEKKHDGKKYVSFKIIPEREGQLNKKKDLKSVLDMNLCMNIAREWKKAAASNSNSTSNTYENNSKCICNT